MSTSHHNTHEFVELRHNVTNKHIITDELDDYHFDMGYRFVRYVPNSEVNYPSVVEYHENLALEQLKNSPSDPYIYYESESRVYLDDDNNPVITEYHYQAHMPLEPKWKQHNDIEIY